MEFHKQSSSKTQMKLALYNLQNNFAITIILPVFFYNEVVNQGKNVVDVW